MSDPGRQLSYVNAILEAQAQLLRDDESIFIAGEDVGAFGGVFGATRGLHEEFGSKRVVDTPISEQAIVGLAIGSAASGLRPIIEIMFMDFIAVCMDGLVNQLAKLRYMFGGTITLPVVVRTLAGAGIAQAAQHSQSLETWLCHTPGLKVVMPSTPYDAKGLIIAAARDDNPVIVIENKVILGMTGDVPEEMYEVPIGVAKIVRSGTDCTVVATGRMVHEALDAATELEAEGISVEVIDPRSLSPLDMDTILESVRKTSRAVIVHEAVRFLGLGAEIAADIQERAFDYLDAPVGRVGAPFSPVPFSPALEQHYVPDAKKIKRAIQATLTRA